MTYNEWIAEYATCADVNAITSSTRCASLSPVQRGMSLSEARISTLV